MGNLQSNTCDESISAVSSNSTPNSRDEGLTQSKHVSREDLRFLIGNLEKFPDSAKKLFAKGKAYLSQDFDHTCTDKCDGNGFFDLFQSFSQADGSTNIANEEDHIESSDLKSGNGFPINSCQTCLFTPLKRSSPLYHAQTYVQWRAAYDMNNMYFPCLKQPNRIYLQPLDQFPHFVSNFRLCTGHVELNFFQTIQAFVEIFFSGFEVLFQSPVCLKEITQLTSRLHSATGHTQYNANDIFPMLQTLLPKDGVCMLAILWTDIFVDDCNFVLGQASNQHKSAILSFGRFEPNSFVAESHTDINEVNGALLWKLFKTASHEVCHVLGLSHCTFFSCAMNESESVDEAMSQPLFLCPVCLRKLQKACGFDTLDRYQQLMQFLINIQSQLKDCSRLLESIQWLQRCSDYLTS